MAETALPEMAVKDKHEDTSAVKPSDPTAFPVPKSSPTALSINGEILEEACPSLKAKGIVRTLPETTPRVADLKPFKLPHILRERFFHLQANLHEICRQFSKTPLINTCIGYMDNIVDASGFVLRRLQRVVEPDSGCLTTCPFLQHYSTCPLVQSSCHSSDSDTIKEDDFKEFSNEVLSTENVECEEPKPDQSTFEQEKDTVTIPKQMPIDAFAPQGSLDMLFYFAFTWLVLYPVNTVVALLNFLRSLTHDVHDYCQLPARYVTIVGRRIVSPRRAIHSRLLTRTQTLLSEVVNLTAGERTMPFKLFLDYRLSTLRAEPLCSTRRATFKRKFSIVDDSLFSGYDDDDCDYEPGSPLETSSDFEGSVTVSENDLSFHEENGLFALKEKPNSSKKNKSDPNVILLRNLEPLEIDESEC